MKSQLNLTIAIEHEDNLDLDASGIAGQVAQFLTSDLGLSEGRLVIVDGRNYISGPVTVFLRSAAIESQRQTEEVTK